MLLAFVVAAAATLATRSDSSVDGARSLARLAAEAANGDSTATAMNAWRGRLAKSPKDRGALLSMVALATLAGRHADADRASVALRGTDGYAMVAQLTRGRAKLVGLDLTGARVAFNEALRVATILGDSSGMSEAMLGRAAIARRTRGAIAARPLLDSAFKLSPDSLSLARIICDDAFTGALGFDHVALAVRATAIAHTAADLRLEARCRVAAGVAYWYRQRFDSTFQWYTSAITLGRQIHDHEAIGAALRWLGYGYRGFGQHERALVNLREAVRESSLGGDSTMLAYEELNLGLVARALRDRALAAAYARSSASRFERGGDEEGRAAVRYLDGGLALDRKDTASARTAFNRGIEWARQSGDANAMGDMQLGLSQLALLQRQWTRASETLDSVAATFRRMGSPQWERALSNRRGALAAAKGDVAETLRWYGVWLGGLTNGQHNARYSTRLQLSLAHLRGGDTKRAETELIAASDELDRYRDSLSDNDLKLHATETLENVGAPVDAAERVIAAMVAEGKLDIAFNLVERRRGRALLERIARSQVANASKTTALPRRTIVPTLDAVGSAIPDDNTAVLEYVASATGAPTSLFVVTRRGSRGYVLAAAESLETAMTAFETLVEAGVKSPPSAKRLGDALLARAVADLSSEVTRLLIVPDGPLHHLSFDALLLRDGKRVVDRFAVGILPSAGVALELWRRGRTARDPWVLAYGDPRFASEQSAVSGDVDRVASSAFFERGGLPRLPSSGEEARDVARYVARSEVRVRDRASESYIKRTPLDSFSVIHFATHALVDDASASRTSLALAPGDGEDGFLDVNELAAISLSADLVVLSACRTARGPIVVGEGVNGLALSMIQGGARSVVATSWRISDTRARSFVNTFYEAMSKGAVVVDALRAAKLAAIARGEPPRDWAGFAVIGDPLARIALTAR
jgi:CHAT domain-containing protein